MNEAKNLAVIDETEKTALTILKNSPIEYYNRISVRCYNDVFKSPSTEISVIKKEFGLTKTRAILSLFIINDIVKMFNVGKGMNDIQIATLVDDIIRNFYYFKVEDFKLCFQNARMRKAVYDRLDGNVILEWLREYDIQRAEVSEQYTINEFKQLGNSVSATYEDYLSNLKDRSESGDTEAKEALERALNVKSVLKKLEPERKIYEISRKNKLNRK